MPWTVVIHGGAGLIDPSSLRYPAEEYCAILQAALKAGSDVLEANGAAIDAVVAAVCVMEDAPQFNCARGSVLTSDGTVECEASLMDGSKRICGSAIGLKTIKNPVLAAKAVLQRTEYAVLVGDSVERLSVEAGLEQCGPEYFITETRKAQLAEVQAALQAGAESQTVLDHGAPNCPLRAALSGDAQGTVGAVAVDSEGRVAAASSTGGMSNKRPGRVGDTPLIGCGLLATPDVAVAATGHGEAFIRQASCARVAHAMEFGGMSVDAAMKAALDKMETGDGGFIAVDASGAWSMQFNTGGMFRGVHVEGGAPEVHIW
jgi:beta-aspartyl-peptidase (threonine type)